MKRKTLKLLSLLLVLILALGTVDAVIVAAETSVAYASSSSEPILFGDVNGDGVVDSADLLLMMRYFSQPGIVINYAAADVNGDGVVDSADLILLMRFFSQPGIVLGPQQQDAPVDNGEVVFHYIYRTHVNAINQPPVYGFTEANGIITITVYNPTYEIRQLSIGDTFVLEPTEQNPSGMAGYVISAHEQNEALIITARQPESLDEIFYEFEFASNIDVLELLDDIELSDELEGVEGVEIIQNRTTLLAANLSNVNVAGITLNGSVRLYTPRVNVSLSRTGVDQLVLTTAASINMNASANWHFDEVINLFTIRLWKFGTGITVPVGIRITSDGQFMLDFTCMIMAQIGFRNNQAVADLSIDYNFDVYFNARATLSLNIQARASILLIPIYGVQGDLGIGIMSNPDIQQRCPVNTCLVIGIFNVKRVSSLDWGILAFLHFSFMPPENIHTHRYITGGRMHRVCPHRIEQGTLLPDDVVGDELRAVPLFNRPYIAVGDARQFIQSGTPWDNIIRLMVNHATLGSTRRENYVVYSLDSMVTRLTGTLNALPQGGTGTATWRFYGDGRLLYAPPSLSAGTPLRQFYIDVTGVNELRIEIVTVGAALLWRVDRNPHGIINATIYTTEEIVRQVTPPNTRAVYLFRKPHIAVGDAAQLIASGVDGDNIIQVMVNHSTLGDTRRENYVVYSLSSMAVLFTGTLNPVASPTGYAVWRFYGDGRLLNAPPAIGGGSPLIPFEIDVRGVNELRIEIVTYGAMVASRVDRNPHGIVNAVVFMME